MHNESPRTARYRIRTLLLLFTISKAEPQLGYRHTRSLFTLTPIPLDRNRHSRALSRIPHRLIHRTSALDLERDHRPANTMLDLVDKFGQRRQRRDLEDPNALDRQRHGRPSLRRGPDIVGGALRDRDFVLHRSRQVDNLRKRLAHVSGCCNIMRAENTYLRLAHRLLSIRGASLPTGTRVSIVLSSPLVLGSEASARSFAAIIEQRPHSIRLLIPTDRDIKLAILRLDRRPERALDLSRGIHIAVRIPMSRHLRISHLAHRPHRNIIIPSRTITNRPLILVVAHLSHEVARELLPFTARVQRALEERGELGVALEDREQPPVAADVEAAAGEQDRFVEAFAHGAAAHGAEKREEVVAGGEQRGAFGVADGGQVLVEVHFVLFFGGVD